MLDWLRRNSEALEALGGIATAFAALTALVIIPYQVAQSDRIQRDQTAREIYREFLNLTVQKPDLANADYCTLTEAGQKTAYIAYVEYLVYTAEQMVNTSPDWRAPMASYLDDHMAYLCSPDAGDPNGDVAALMADLALVCDGQTSCD